MDENDAYGIAMTQVSCGYYDQVVIIGNSTFDNAGYIKWWQAAVSVSWWNAVWGDWQ